MYIYMAASKKSLKGGLKRAPRAKTSCSIGVEPTLFHSYGTGPWSWSKGWGRSAADDSPAPGSSGHHGHYVSWLAPNTRATMTKWLLKSNSTSTRIKNKPCDTNDGHDKGPGAVWLGTGGMEQVWNRYGTGMEQDGSTIQIRNFELSPAVPYLFHTCSIPPVPGQPRTTGPGSLALFVLQARPNYRQL